MNKTLSRYIACSYEVQGRLALYQCSAPATKEWVHCMEERIGTGVFRCDQHPPEDALFPNLPEAPERK